MIIQAIRSAIFYAAFIGLTAILAIIAGIAAPFARGRFVFGWAIANFWVRANLFLLRWLVGIRTEVTGMENIPEGGCMVASKHQSDWDIFALFPHVPEPAFLAKQELMDLPFFGKAARRLNVIPVDRKRGGETLAKISTSTKEAVDRGCHIIIFPEGTRRAPLTDPAYKFGVARLYGVLNVPIVPVAVNSGLFWARNSPILWPGLASARFLPPIPAGLSPEDMHNEMVARIEEASNELILEAAERGLTRPLTPEQHKNLEILRQKKAETGAPDDQPS